MEARRFRPELSATIRRWLHCCETGRSDEFRSILCRPDYCGERIVQNVGRAVFSKVRHEQAQCVERSCNRLRIRLFGQHNRSWSFTVFHGSRAMVSSSQRAACPGVADCAGRSTMKFARRICSTGMAPVSGSNASSNALSVALRGDIITIAS